MENKLIISNLVNFSLSHYIKSSSPLTRISEESRIRIFENWLKETQQNHFSVDLVAYAEHLQHERGLQGSTVNAHLKSIRGRYRTLMKTNDYRNLLLKMAQDQVPNGSVGDVLAMVNEIDKRIQNSIFTDSFVREVSKQDKTDEELGTRLNESQVQALLEIIDISSPIGSRDAALFAVGICTGLREFELANLQVDDLRQSYDGKLAIRVREGKGAKQRLIPYGSLDWCLLYVDMWLRKVDIQDGFIFRGFLGKSRKIIRKTGISVRMINYIVGNYPVRIQGNLRTLKPHDLRRTYARLQYENGMSPEALQQNMGHESYDTTLRYIGSLDAEARQSKAKISLPREHLKLLYS